MQVTTKYDMGQILFFVSNNKAHQKPVISIDVSVKQFQTLPTKYGFYVLNNKVTIPENKLYVTKEELWGSL
jgi:hypothetical protein